MGVCVGCFVVLVVVEVWVYVWLLVFSWVLLVEGVVMLMYWFDDEI